MTNPHRIIELGEGMWSSWQEKVRASLPNFAAHPVYVDQSQSEEEFQQVAEYVWSRAGELPAQMLDGLTRDAEFGARVVNVVRGEMQRIDVTRTFLDSCVEIDFLRRTLGLRKLEILDIGAGYGRLAASLAPLVDRYICVDPVPISTEICRTYCARFAPTVEVPSIHDFLAIYRGHYRGVNLAINIHSWNECTREQISAWLDILDDMRVPFLFTVSHGQNDGSIEQSYYAWEPGRPSWRPLIEERYELLAEEGIGFSKHPHACWRRR